MFWESENFLNSDRTSVKIVSSLINWGKYLLAFGTYTEWEMKSGLIFTFSIDFVSSFLSNSNRFSDLSVVRKLKISGSNGFKILNFFSFYR